MGRFRTKSMVPSRLPIMDRAISITRTHTHFLNRGDLTGFRAPLEIVVQSESQFFIIFNSNLSILIKNFLQEFRYKLSILFGLNQTRSAGWEVSIATPTLFCNNFALNRFQRISPLLYNITHSQNCQVHRISFAMARST